LHEGPERFAIGDDAAFQVLVRTSQDTNMKLTAVAEWLTRERIRAARPDAGS
jgi:hypothetical protein